MGSAVGLRGDFSALDLRALARRSVDAAQVRRLLALAVIYAGGTRRDAALAGGVGFQRVRDWVLRFNAQGPEGLIGGKAPGKQPLLNAAQREALAGAVEAGPELALHGVVRWRIADLVAWLQGTFGVTVSPQTLGRELRALGYRKLSARPRHHAQVEGAIADFKKTSPPCWQKSGKASRQERP
jgi:transposase